MAASIEAAYYGAPPGWIGQRVQVQWNGGPHCPPPSRKSPSPRSRTTTKHDDRAEQSAVVATELVQSLASREKPTHPVRRGGSCSRKLLSQDLCAHRGLQARQQCSGVGGSSTRPRAMAFHSRRTRRCH